MRSVWQDLWNRRVPHVVGIYLGISWGILEFVGFLVDQYVLSPHLVSLCLVVLASLIPSVMIVTYFHGKPGHQGWGRAERVTVPVNLLGLAALVAVMFAGKDLGAATTTVVVTDEDGIETERVIPKSEFRKHVTIFFFDAEPTDTAAAWLRYGLPVAVIQDLHQNHFLDLGQPVLFPDRLREAGFEDLTGIPLSLQREVAEEQHDESFVAGRITVKSGVIQATISLFDTKKGRLLTEHTFSGTDPFTLADEISLQMRNDLGVPEFGEESAQDLPVSEVLTTSFPAFRLYVEAIEAVAIGQNWVAAIPLLEEATQVDPTFAEAQRLLAVGYRMANRSPESIGPLQSAMDHLYRLPERFRFLVKSDYYYLIRQDVDRAFSSIEMWADLFPDDIAAYQMLAQMQATRDDKAGQLASLWKILELDPGQWAILLQIGNLQEVMGDYAAALESFQTYAEEFPEDHQVLIEMAGVIRAGGNPEEARDLYNRALLLAPSDVGVITGMGRAEFTLGRFDEALRQYDAGMAEAGTAAERAEVLSALTSYYESRGQIGRAIEHLEQRLAEQSSYLPAFNYEFGRVTAAATYVEAGRDAEAFAMVGEARDHLGPPWDAYVALGDLEIHLARNDADAVEATLPAIEALVTNFQMEMLRPTMANAQGRVHELRGEYLEAIEDFEEERRLNPSDRTIPRQLGRCYRELGEYDQALGLLQEALRVSPFGARTNYEIALTYEAMGRLEEARTHLGRALDVWADADPTFQRAQRAREALARIQGGLN